MPATERHHHLQALDQATTDLEQALTQEADAVRAGDMDSLLQAVQTKGRALHHLDMLVGAAGLRDQLQQIPTDADTDADPVAALALRLRQCRHQNIATGGALATARRMTELALQMLGQHQRTEVYGRQGQASAARSGRDLGQA